jgi:eukaryotic-like serine/threonine-protein kinase
VPVLIVIDDSHWADSSTTALAVAVLRQNIGSRLMILGTHRHADTDATAAVTAMAELQRDRMLETIALEGLDGTSVEQLVRHLDPAAQPNLLDVIKERAEGNPYFVEEMVGAVRGRASESSAVTVPSSIRMVLDRRLGQLDDRARQRLRSAAVLGREFDADLAAVLCECEPLDLLDDLEVALDKGLVVEAPEVIGRFAFAHALLRDALLDGMSGLRRRHLHRAAAEAISQGTGRSAVVSADATIAHHLLAAGFREDVERAAHHLVKAAQRAIEVFAYQEAIDACRSALEADADGSLPSSLVFELLCEQGTAELADGRRRNARATFLQAAEIARAERDGVRLAVALTRSLWGSFITVEGFYGIVDTDRAKLLEEALLLLGDSDPPLRVRVLGHLATVLLHDPESTRREAVAEEALSLALALDDPMLRAVAYGAKRTAFEASPTATLQERLSCAQSAREYADQSGDLALRITMRIATIDEVLAAADVTLFDRLLDEADELISPIGQPRLRWFVECARAGRPLMNGDYTRAASLADQARAMAGRTLGSLPFGAWAQQRTLLQRDAGKFDQTIELLAPLPMDDPQMWSLRAGLCLAYAESGDPAAAAALLQRSVDAHFADVGRDSAWPGTMAWFAEAALLIGDRRAASMIDAYLVGNERQLSTVAGSGIAGTNGRIRGLIACAHGDLDGAEHHLQDALDLLRSIDAHPWIARTAHALATVKKRQGATAAASALAEEAAAIAARIGLVLPESP